MAEFISVEVENDAVSRLTSSILMHDIRTPNGVRIIRTRGIQTWRGSVAGRSMFEGQTAVDRTTTTTFEFEIRRGTEKSAATEGLKGVAHIIGE